MGDPRETAGRVATWLMEQNRPDEAVALLCAWAVRGGNDAAGQSLLADAMRIDPGATLAQQAFERMESIAGDHAALDAAMAHFDEAALLRLDAERVRPTFRRAQMGFNNNIKTKGQVFHVQTEDSGLDNPHIITHLFADGGRVVKSHKRTYAAEVKRADVATFVRGLMKAQHMEMVLALRDGRFDAILEGREVGGLELLTTPPNVDVLKLGPKKKAEPPAVVSAQPVDASQPTLYSMTVLRSLSGGPDSYQVKQDIAIIGAKGPISLPGEIFCHPEEAVLSYRGGRLFLEDLEGGNGVFLRIRTPVELEMGDEFVVGDQLLRILKNPVADDAPDPDPTYFYSSPKWVSSFRVVQIFAGGAAGATVVARGNTLQIGSVVGDMVFGDDPLVEQQHCVVEEQAGTILLTDLGSRTGVFVRVRGEQELSRGDEVLVGRTRLVVQTPAH